MIMLWHFSRKQLPLKNYPEEEDIIVLLLPKQQWRFFIISNEQLLHTMMFVYI